MSEQQGKPDFYTVSYKQDGVSGYTFHYFGEKLETGTEVKLPSRRGTDGAWVRGWVLCGTVEPGFDTKAIIGLVDEGAE